MHSCLLSGSVKVLATQSFMTLCSPMDHSLPGSPVMGFSRQESWSGLPFPLPGDLPDPGIEPMSPALQEDSLWSEPHLFKFEQKVGARRHSILCLLLSSLIMELQNPAGWCFHSKSDFQTHYMKGPRWVLQWGCPNLRF